LLKSPAGYSGSAVLGASSVLPYEFDPSKKIDRWGAFLDQIFDGDKERMELMQEWYGYCLVPDISFHKLMVKIGVIRAGKGVSDRMLQRLLGEGNWTAYNLHSLADKFGLRNLPGKLVAFVGEVNLAGSRDKYRILETLNSIVGGDPQSIERKNFNECPSVVLPTRFNVSCNEMPKFVDPTGALASRMLVLNFDRSFYGEEDRSLEDKLSGELSAICNWALEGYRRLKEQGHFTEGERTKRTAMECRRENSDIFAFVQDMCLVHRSVDPGNLDGVPIEVDPKIWTAC